MNTQTTIRPTLVTASAKLDHVRMFPRNYIWLDLYGDQVNCTAHVEITYLNDKIIIHLPAEMVEQVELVPYDEDGNAPGTQGWEVMP